MSAMRQKKCIFGRFSPLWCWVWARFPLFGAFSAIWRVFRSNAPLLPFLGVPMAANVGTIACFFVVAPCRWPAQDWQAFYPRLKFIWHIPGLFPAYIFVSPTSPHQKIKNFCPILYFRFGILAKTRNKTLPFSLFSWKGCAFSAAWDHSAPNFIFYCNF